MDRYKALIGCFNLEAWDNRQHLDTERFHEPSLTLCSHSRVLSREIEHQLDLAFQHPDAQDASRDEALLQLYQRASGFMSQNGFADEVQRLLEDNWNYYSWQILTEGSAAALSASEPFGVEHKAFDAVMGLDPSLSPKPSPDRYTVGMNSAFRGLFGLLLTLDTVFQEARKREAIKNVRALLE